jgi:hypothetical protein
MVPRKDGQATLGVRLAFLFGGFVSLGAGYGLWQYQENLQGDYVVIKLGAVVLSGLGAILILAFIASLIPFEDTRRSNLSIWKPILALLCIWVVMGAAFWLQLPGWLAGWLYIICLFSGGIIIFVWLKNTVREGIFGLSIVILSTLVHFLFLVPIVFGIKEGNWDLLLGPIGGAIILLILSLTYMLVRK